LSLFSHNPALTELYTLSLHDALPILPAAAARRDEDRVVRLAVRLGGLEAHQGRDQTPSLARSSGLPAAVCRPHAGQDAGDRSGADRKSTRLNSSHRTISYAVFCLKKK